MENHSYLGIGIYGVPEAARLTGVSAPRIRRWVKGYTFRVRGSARRSAPVWQSQLPRLDHQIAVSFLDLIEIRFVNAFLEHGVSWPTIRKVERGDPTVALGVAFEAASVLGVVLFHEDAGRRTLERERVEGQLLLLPQTVRAPTVIDDDF